MKKLILFIIVFLPVTEICAQWIGTRSSCNVTCMSEGYNPASGHMVWGEKGTIGGGVTFALEGVVIVGGEIFAANGPVSRENKSTNPNYAACGVLGAQFNPLCLSIRLGVGQYSKTENNRTTTGPKKFLFGGYITAMITDRVGLELGGDSFNGSTIGLSYQF